MGSSVIPGAGETPRGTRFLQASTGMVVGLLRFTTTALGIGLEAGGRGPAKGGRGNDVASIGNQEGGHFFCILGPSHTNNLVARHAPPSKQ